MIIHADNFSMYGTNVNLMLNGIYAGVSGASLVADPDGISPGYVFKADSNGSNSNTPWRYVFQTGNTDSAGVALRMWWPSLPTNNFARTKVIEFRSNANEALAHLSLTSAGNIEVRILSDTDPYNETYFVTDFPVVTAQGWYHVELRYDSGVSAGFELRVEGVPVLSADGVLGNSAQIAQAACYRQNISGDVAHFIKDLVIWTTEGTYNTDFLGTVLVTNLRPTADVSLNWAPSTGTNGWSILDNSPPDNAQYISAEDLPIPGAYVGELSNLPVEATSVKALVTFVRAAKIDGGDGSLQAGLISSPASDPATSLGANRPITVAQTYWRDVFEIDPKTGAPWLPPAVNQAQLRINRTT